MISGTTFNRTVNDSSVTLCGGTEWDYGASITLSGKDRTDNNGNIIIRAKDNSNVSDFILNPNGTATWGNKNLAMQEDFIPRSGGAVLTGATFTRTVDNSYLAFKGSTATNTGASIWLYGKDESKEKGKFWIGASDTRVTSWLVGSPEGSLIWKGQPIQYGSDARLKQQISNIDDKLLDAWEDVNLVQFKYNDAVDQKGKDKARLHTGYVVQQIDKACQSHGVDISDYGLYCHEEYPQETEEVEVTQDDGTTKKETKVIREASEHYSLRYTETLVVECAYLRREVSKLKQQNENLEQRLKMLEQSVK